jgi:uncharacterized protein (UPF0548 family)
MPRRPSLPRRLRTASRWPVGVALTSWRYMWRTTPLHRSETTGELPADGPPDVPANVSEDEVQYPEAGAGPLFHRIYRARIRDARLGPDELMAAMSADLDRVAPSEFASFNKVLGEEGGLAVGDEYVVRMPGPWDGPVRVVERTPRSFRLVTLDGHLEAGQIVFAAEPGELLEFRIESWARAGDRLSNLLYDHLRMSKEVQLHMWTSVLERVARLAGGRLTGGVEIRTARVDSRGWHVDAWSQRLPDETPGDPAPGGPWEIAKRLMVDYRMADPEIVRAHWNPDAPLEGREMQLELRLRGIVSVRVRVRVTRVWDEQRAVAGRQTRVFGYEYVALRGHVELGAMSYEVSKRLDDGTIEFQLHAHSHASHEGPLWIRLGFRIFGRREQLRFYRRCCERMARLTAGELGLHAAPPPPVQLGKAA